MIATSPQHGQTKLQWQTPATNSEDITGYEYRRRPVDSDAWAPDWTLLTGSDRATTETVLTVPEAEATTVYRFQVRALSASDASEPSNEATLLPRLSLIETIPDATEIETVRFSNIIRSALISPGMEITFRARITAVGEITGTKTYTNTGSYTAGGFPHRENSGFNFPVSFIDNPITNRIIESTRSATFELLPNPNAEGFISYSVDVTANQRMFELAESNEPEIGLDFTNEAGDESLILCSDGMTREDSGQATIIGIRFFAGVVSAWPLPRDVIDLAFTSSDPSEAKLALSPDDTPVSPLIVPDAVNNLGFIRGIGPTLRDGRDYLGPIYVIGQDDDVDEPDRTTYTISVTFKSDNPVWDSSNLDLQFCEDTIGFANLDDDTAAVNVAFADPSSDTTTEAGGAGAFTVALASEPTAEVVVTVTADDPTDAPAKTLTLTFDADNWNTSQTVTVIGQGDDAGDTPMTPTTISFAVASDDPFYDDAREPRRGVTPASLQVDGPVTALEGPAGSALRLRLRLRVFLESALP